MWFHSDGSNNAWGFKLTAKGTSIVDKTPPPVPAPLLSILFSLLRSSSLKAIIALGQQGALSPLPLSYWTSMLKPSIRLSNASPVNLALPKSAVSWLSRCCVSH